MGAEQSSQAGPSLKSQRDEDIPYTSCSMGKPICVEQRGSSPRLASKARPTSKDMREPALHSIVVVAEGVQSEPEVDEELTHLLAIPSFRPLLVSSFGSSSSTDTDTIGKLDVRHILGLCMRLQEHMKQCADAVAFDQNALCVRIKEVDYIVQTLYHSLTERQKRFAKYAEQIQKVNEVSTVLSRVQMNIEQTVPLMERLNSVLPAEEQLEPFTLKPSK